MAAAAALNEDFESYLTRFSKKYATLEEHARRKVLYEEMQARVALHNSGDSSWTAGINEYSDWSNEEFRARRTGTRGPSAGLFSGAAAPHEIFHGALPASVDWRAHTPKVVSAVKNQGGCGSCWAFSATETLESHIAIKTGKLFTLSPQQIVSCAPDPDSCGGTGGCSGSTQQLGYNYTITAGITTEASYPYQGETGICQPGKIKPVAGITGYTTVQPNNYTALASALAFRGPVAITVDAGGIGWQMYHHGVYSGGLFGCGYALDHGVQVVGYGTDGGKGYWWVRNSWGAGWGEEGYMRLGRFGEGKEPCGIDKAPADGIACKGNTTKVQYCGECGILSSSSYPTGCHLQK